MATNVFASTVEISSDAFPIIPSSAVSCLSWKTAVPGQAPLVDVSPSYFRIPQIMFKNHSDKPLIISVIRITFPELGLVCDSAGDSLSALFPGVIGKEIVIAPKSFAATDCALYCGGIKVGNQSARYEGKMDVYGIYSDRGNTDDIPEMISTSISIQNF